MTIRLRRPRYQRNVRILLAAALLVPAAGFFPAAARATFPAADPGAFVPVVAVGVLALLALVCIYDALRWVVLITVHGIGIAGTFGTGTTWIAWTEIVRVETHDGTAVLATKGQQLYQLELSSRMAGFLCRMVKRHLVRM